MKSIWGKNDKEADLGEKFQIIPIKKVYNYKTYNYTF